MTQRWFVDSTRAQVDWATAVIGGTARLDIYEIVQRQDRSETALLRFRFASNGQAVAAARVDAAKAATASAAVPAGTLYDAAARGKAGGTLVDNGDGTATWTPST